MQKIISPFKNLSLATFLQELLIKLKVLHLRVTIFNRAPTCMALDKIIFLENIITKKDGLLSPVCHSKPHFSAFAKQESWN